LNGLRLFDLSSILDYGVVVQHQGGVT
jgi:hypothetical protein